MDIDPLDWPMSDEENAWWESYLTSYHTPTTVQPLDSHQMKETHHA